MRAPLAAVLLGALLSAGCSAEGERRGRAFMPEMFDAVPVESYAPLEGTEGKRLPPEGTVPASGGPFPYGTGPEEALRAGAELVNPLEPAEAEVARGKTVYETVCIVCHGPGGQGDGPIIGRFPNPPSLTAPRAVALPDGQVVHIVARGQGLMPSHAAQVLPLDRWRVTLYLRTLQQGTATAPPAPAAVPTAVAVENGEKAP